MAQALPIKLSIRPEDCALLIEFITSDGLPKRHSGIVGFSLDRRRAHPKFAGNVRHHAGLLPRDRPLPCRPPF